MLADRGFIHVDADEDQFLTAVAPDRVPARLDPVPAIPGVGPVTSSGTDAHHWPAAPVWTRAPAWLSSPTQSGRVASQKKPLARTTPGHERVDEASQALRMEGPAGAR